MSFYRKPSKIQPYESDSSSQEVILCSSNSPHDFSGLLFEEKSTQHASQALNNAKSSTALASPAFRFFFCSLISSAGC